MSRESQKFKRSFIVSIIGRPNVGKSTLFNRLMKKQHKAITYDTPGVTRDRHYGLMKCDARSDLPPEDIILVDTGGFFPEKIDLDEVEKNNINAFFNLMADHAMTAIEESDLVLFVVDVREGVSPHDERIIRKIRQKNRPFWLIANKFDSDKQQGSESEFYTLGIDQEQLYCVSSAHNRGVIQLSENLHAYIARESEKVAERPGISAGVGPRFPVVSRVALIGAPNAGKSTLLNQLIGQERALVSDIPGTTVDPIEGFFSLDFKESAELLKDFEGEKLHDSHLIEEYEHFRKNHPDVYRLLDQEYHEDQFTESEEELDWEGENDEIYLEESAIDTAFPEQELQDELSLSEEVADGLRSIHLIDTAGIRKKSKLSGEIETQSVYRSLRCITESDVVLLMVDATLGLNHQDRRLMDIALEKGKSIIICMNKIDLIMDKLKGRAAKREWLQNLRDKIPWLEYCDIIGISAREGLFLSTLKKSLIKTILVRHQKIPTGELNSAMLELVEKNPIILKKSAGKKFKIKYASMVKSSPPTFLFFANKINGIPENFKRYLKNGLRRYFCLDNTPIHLVFRRGGDLEKKLKLIN